MNYKTILTILDMSERSEERIRYAIDLAKQHEASLFGVAPQEIAGTLFVGDFMSTDSKWLDELQATIDSDSQLAIQQFIKLCSESDFTAFDYKCVRGSAADILSSESSSSDIVVLSQHIPGNASTLNTAGLVEHSLMVSSTPVLTIPSMGRYKAPPKNVLIGWQDTRECSHAIRQALPLLRKANQVELLEILHNDSKKSAQGNKEGILRYLKAHQVEAKISTQYSTIEPGDVLLSYACDVGADLLVMGGYGHNRLREWALGGVTNTILETMTVPALMAH